MPSPSDGAPFEVWVETDRIDRSCDGRSALGTFFWKFQSTSPGIKNETDGATADGLRDRLSRAPTHVETACGSDFDLGGLIGSEFNHFDLTESDIT